MCTCMPGAKYSVYRTNSALVTPTGVQVVSRVPPGSWASAPPLAKVPLAKPASVPATSTGGKAGPRARKVLVQLQDNALAM
jgi:hypothetical protein